MYMFSTKPLGTRDQPIGANAVFQHSELMVKTIEHLLKFLQGFIFALECTIYCNT